MLRNGGQALVQEVFQAVVICPNGEAAPPEVWTPVTHRLDQANELTLICCQGVMSRCDLPAEEGDGVSLLDEDSTKPVGRCVALDDEGLGEIRHSEHRCRGDCLLQGEESRSSLRTPGEALLLEERGERRGDGAVVVDELAVVARKPKEAAHRPCGARYRPIVNGLYLGGVHGHPCRRDRVAEVSDRGDPESTLGAFDEEGVLTKLAEDGAEVS